jgi:Cell wall-active antibiotics response 4TMS YvqF
VDLAGSRPRPTRLTAALLGHVTRRGRLRLRRWALAASAFGDLDFDLRDAVIERPQTTVTVLAALGNVDISVPEGVNVDVAGLAIFGHRRDWGRDVDRPDAPWVRVRVLGVAGTIDVWRVPHDLCCSRLQRDLPPTGRPSAAASRLTPLGAAARRPETPGTAHHRPSNRTTGRQVRPAGARPPRARPALDADVKDMIAAQLDGARGRLAAIWHDSSLQAGDP